MSTTQELVVLSSCLGEMYGFVADSGEKYHTKSKQKTLVAKSSLLQKSTDPLE